MRISPLLALAALCSSCQLTFEPVYFRAVAQRPDDGPDGAVLGDVTPVIDRTDPADSVVIVLDAVSPPVDVVTIDAVVPPPVDVLTIDSVPLPVDVVTVDNVSPPVDVVTADILPPCPAGQTRCGSTCVETLTSTMHCGGCGNRCEPFPNASPLCNAGTCDIRCASGSFGNCDGNPINGCETRLDTPAHCGRCGVVCPARPGEIPVCASGTCRTECMPGRADCNANPMDGCETLLTTPGNCGACGRACEPRAPTCDATTLPAACRTGVTCLPGWSFCSTTCRDLAFDPNNCGTCGNVCRSPMGTAVCVDGLCRSCAPGSTQCLDSRSPNFGRCCTSGCSGACSIAMSM